MCIFKMPFFSSMSGSLVYSYLTFTQKQPKSEAGWSSLCNVEILNWSKSLPKSIYYAVAGVSQPPLTNNYIWFSLELNFYNTFWETKHVYAEQKRYFNASIFQLRNPIFRPLNISSWKNSEPFHAFIINYRSSKSEW